MVLLLLLHHAGQASFPSPSPRPSLLAPSCLLAYSTYGMTAPQGRLRVTARGCPIVVKATTVRSAVLHSAFSLSLWGDDAVLQSATLHLGMRLKRVERSCVQRHDTTRLDDSRSCFTPSPPDSTIVDSSSHSVPAPDLYDTWCLSANRRLVTARQFQFLLSYPRSEPSISDIMVHRDEAPPTHTPPDRHSHSTTPRHKQID